jgi:hypothetical protein
MGVEVLNEGSARSLVFHQDEEWGELVGQPSHSPEQVRIFEPLSELVNEVKAVVRHPPRLADRIAGVVSYLEPGIPTLNNRSYPRFFFIESPPFSVKDVTLWRHRTLLI